MFFDRDGVINEDYGYVGHKDQFTFIPGVKQALKELRLRGYLLILVTNQSGIARGYYTEDDFWALCDWMQDELESEFALFDGIYFCPYHPNAVLAQYRQESDFRKPAPGMLLQAMNDFDLDPADCVMVGDHASDLEAGRRAGVQRLVLVGTHLQEELPKLPTPFVYPQLSQAAADWDRIERGEKK